MKFGMSDNFWLWYAIHVRDRLPVWLALLVLRLMIYRMLRSDSPSLGRLSAWRLAGQSAVTLAKGTWLK